MTTYKSLATFYFHWPFCQQICTYCNFNKYVNSEEKYGQSFENSLKSAFLKETETILGLTSVEKIKSLYFGGGTPSLASIETIESIINQVRCFSTLNKDAEISIECNPSSDSIFHKLENYSRIGINRVSIGIQSLNNSTLKLLRRDHTAQEGLDMLKQAQQIFGNDGVTVDLIFGKPGDTVESWVEELGTILSHNVSHISLYELTSEKSTVLFKQIKSAKIQLPNKDETALMYEKAIELVQPTQLRRYEVSSFAKPGAESRHNSSYWNGTQYIGIGPGAHSRFFLKDAVLREARIQCLEPKKWQSMVDLNGHGTHLRRSQSNFEILTELLATSLRTINGVQQERWQIFEPNHSIRGIFEENSQIKNLCSNGLLCWTSQNLCATERGISVVDAILPIVLKALIKFYK